MRTLPGIIAKLTEKGEDFAHMTYIGPNYTKADLLADLRAIQTKGVAAATRAKISLEILGRLDG